MGRKLREDHITCIEQFLRTGNIRDVGVDFTGINRKIFQTIHLRTFDLGIPISTLNQTHHNAVIGAARQINDEIQYIRAALAISLHNKADTFPALELFIKAKAFEQIERDFQTVCFLGINIEADIVGFGNCGQSFHFRQQFIHHACYLRAGIARMQGRQLDGNTRACINTATGRGFTNRVNGIFIVFIIALGILCGGRSLAQHIIRIAKAFLLQHTGAFYRFINGFTGDELFAHHPHRHINATAHNRLAATRNHAGERCRQTTIIDCAGEFAGNHQPPSGRIDE